MMSADFQRFFDRSTRVVERALCEMADANLFVDYTGGYGDDDNEGLDGDKFGEKFNNDNPHPYDVFVQQSYV